MPPGTRLRALFTFLNNQYVGLKWNTYPVDMTERKDLNNYSFFSAVLTILALVSQEVCRAAAGGLVSTINCAVSSILTVVLACALVTVGSCEACQTTASRSSWKHYKTSFLCFIIDIITKSFWTSTSSLVSITKYMKVERSERQVSPVAGEQCLPGSTDMLYNSVM